MTRGEVSVTLLSENTVSIPKERQPLRGRMADYIAQKTNEAYAEARKH